MHLTYRPSGWRFQIRIPRDLEALIGTSPIRLNIGPLAKRRAARVARLLGVTPRRYSSRAIREHA